MVKKKALKAAERQRRYREKRKNYLEKLAEVKRKDLERYHTRKKLVADMTVRENGNNKMKKEGRTSNQNHGPSAIWAHLNPVLSEIQTNHPTVTTVHFFSDGPATQCKQKINFYLMAYRFFEQFKFRKISWNFFESGQESC